MALPTLTDLMKALKVKMQAVPALESLSGRMTYGIASDKNDVADAPYIVVTLISNPQIQESYADGNGNYLRVDTLNVQFSVYATGLAAAEEKAAALEAALHRTILPLDNGKMVSAQTIERGLIREPKNKQSVSVFHAFRRISFMLSN